MSAVFLTLVGALASVLPVRGTSRCPTPAAVARQLGALTARARARGHVAEVDSSGDRVRLRLLDSAGHLLAQRWLRTAEGCEGRAKAAAVVLATLELEPKSEPALLPPAPPPQPSPDEEPPPAVAPTPPEPAPVPPPSEDTSPPPAAPEPSPPETPQPQAAPASPASPEPPKPEAPPEPPEPRQQPQAPSPPEAASSAPAAPAAPPRRIWQIDAAVEGSMTSDVTWTLGGELGASVTPLAAPLAFRLTVRVEGERAVGLGPGSVAYSRQGLGLGLGYPFQVGPLELSLEAEGLAAVALIRTAGFSRLGSDQEIDPGVGLGVRLSKVFSWGSLFAGLWPTAWLVSDRITVTGAGSASPPQVELFLGLGVASPRL